MRIQYVSDIHLEHHRIWRADQLNPRTWVRPVEGADVLVLAGDVGWPDLSAYGLFMQWCSDNWPAVVVVAGNHEFYTEGAVGGVGIGKGPKICQPEKLELLRKIAASLPNVHFLDRGRVKVGGVTFLGATLWSAIPADLGKYALQSLNDFRCVLSAPGRWVTLEEYGKWHAADVAWLRGELVAARAAGETVVVVTHHMPTPKLIHEKYAGHPLNCCFATDLEWLIQEGAPVAWICGHSHTGNRITLGQTQLALNPVGYPGERVETRSPQAVLEVAGAAGAAGVLPAAAAATDSVLR